MTNKDDDFRLCFISDNRAWFTTCRPFFEQTGVGWDGRLADAYPPIDRLGIIDSRLNVLPVWEASYVLTSVFFEAELEELTQPDLNRLAQMSGRNDTYTVRQINENGNIAWLRSIGMPIDARSIFDDRKVNTDKYTVFVPSGMTLTMFKWIIRDLCGGKVFVEERESPAPTVEELNKSMALPVSASTAVARTSSRSDYFDLDDDTPIAPNPPVPEVEEQCIATGRSPSPLSVPDYIQNEVRVTAKSRSYDDRISKSIEQEIIRRGGAPYEFGFSDYLIDDGESMMRKAWAEEDEERIARIMEMEGYVDEKKK